MHKMIPANAVPSSLHWNQKVLTVTILLSLDAPKFVLTAHSLASDDEVVTVMVFGFQYYIWCLLSGWITAYAS